VIAFLRGRLLRHDDREIVVDAGGVGYVLEVDARTDAALPPAGAEVELYVYTLVREDALELFGFATWEERELFLTLLKVQGIGPRLGQAILATFSLDELETITSTGDAKTLARVPGIGPRTAERLIVEMKRPLARLRGGRPRPGPVAVPGSALADAAEALSGLGFRRVEIDAVIAALRTDRFAGDATEAVREALRRLSR